MTNLRNLAIIAHVDHGKTTLIDAMLSQAGTFHKNQMVQERAMDRNDLERERGITILSKCTSLQWGDVRMNIVDTPGHADFGGEVERILSMVDGVILLVDSSEGPMPQTKFVLTKALKLGLKPIVVINKADKPEARVDEVLNEVFDLFVLLDANESQLDFPVLYASGKNGWCVKELGEPQENLKPLFDLICTHVPSPDVDVNAPFSMLVTMLEYDSFLGQVLTGRVHSGKIKVNQEVKGLTREGELVEKARLTKLMAFQGLERKPVEEAMAGDIIAVAGLTNTTVSNTLCAPQVTEALSSQPIDPPTLAMTFSINDSPLAGQEGDKVTSRLIRSRLFQEALGNISIRVSEAEDKDSFEVAGRGELQLGVLIETMRREGFELSISRPRVLLKKDEETGETLEPIEEMQVDVDEEFVGSVVEKVGLRKGEMIDMSPSGGGKTRVIFLVPSRGLIGYQGEFLTDTRGTGIMNRSFHGYAPYKGTIPGRRNGALISTGNGQAVGYALNNLEERGVLFVKPGDAVYEGMVIGENSKDNDLEVNPLKAKQLTNVRASGKDDAIRLSPPRVMTLEQSISYIQDDELIEVTPGSIRLRKRLLCPHDRKKESRRKES